MKRFVVDRVSTNMRRPEGTTVHVKIQRGMICRGDDERRYRRMKICSAGLVWRLCSQVTIDNDHVFTT